MKFVFVSKGARHGFQIGRYVNVFCFPIGSTRKVYVCTFCNKIGVWAPTDPVQALTFNCREFRVINEALEKQGSSKDIDFSLDIAIPPPQ